MTTHNVADLVLESDQLSHFTEMLNVCLAGIPRSPQKDYENISRILEELEKHLKQVVPPRVTRDELNRLISEWIDQKISQTKEIPAPG